MLFIYRMNFLLATKWFRCGFYLLILMLFSGNIFLCSNAYILIMIINYMIILNFSLIFSVVRSTILSQQFFIEKAFIGENLLLLLTRY